MEVHHAHAPAKEKHFRHYLFEFLMLFLAITLGFFVENMRERYTEHLREKEFARLLYADLKKDTAWLHRIITVKEWRGKKIDSLFYLMTQPDLQKKCRPYILLQRFFYNRSSVHSQ